MQWHMKSFNQLSIMEFYQIAQLRVDVFVVEQNCPYSDLDDKDHQPEAIHLFATDSHKVVTYLRILPPSSNQANMPIIGRVVTLRKYRGRGLGHDMLQKAITLLDDNWPGLTCHISAQTHLQHFYQKHGFISLNEEYLEDGIPHIAMERVTNTIKNSSPEK